MTESMRSSINPLIDLVAYGVKRSKHDYEGFVATIILDGCGDCGSFWFDKGEIDKIRNAYDVDGWEFRPVS